MKAHPIQIGAAIAVLTMIGACGGPTGKIAGRYESRSRASFQDNSKAVYEGRAKLLFIRIDLDLKPNGTFVMGPRPLTTGNWHVQGDLVIIHPTSLAGQPLSGPVKEGGFKYSPDFKTLTLWDIASDSASMEGQAFTRVGDAPK